MDENAGTRATLHKIGQTCRLTRYAQLTQVESVFRSLKSELGIRPIYHQLEHRADAHVLIALVAYCLQVTLKNRLFIHASGLRPAAVLEKLATIQMVEVWIPMVDGRWLVLPRHTQPEKDLQAILNHMRWASPSPPRVKGSQVPSVPKTSLPPSPPCGEDLSFAFTEIQQVTLCQTAELPKLGSSPEPPLLSLASIYALHLKL